MFSESRAIYRTGVEIHWNRYPCCSGMTSHLIRVDFFLFDRKTCLKADSGTLPKMVSAPYSCLKVISGRNPKNGIYFMELFMVEVNQSLFMWVCHRWKHLHCNLTKFSQSSRSLKHVHRCRLLRECSLRNF